MEFMIKVYFVVLTKWGNHILKNGNPVVSYNFSQLFFSAK